jgi:hypothetical protein
LAFEFAALLAVVEGSKEDDEGPPPPPPTPPVKSEKLKSGMLRSPVLVSTGKYLSHSFWRGER